MAASYPTAVKTFTSRNNGDTIQASHVNDLQDEVNAVESGLKSGLAHNVIFTPDATYDIGASAATRPRDFYLSRNAVIGGTVNVFGQLGVPSGQIVFPPTQIPAVGANTLDDYEEGSWTPSWGGTTSESGQVYSAQVGRYTKWGNTVNCRCTVTLSTLGTITGSLQLEGLPFTSANTAARATLVIGYWTGLTTNWIWLGGYIAANSNVAQIVGRQSAGTGVTALVQGDLSATTDMIISFTYEADA